MAKKNVEVEETEVQEYMTVTEENLLKVKRRFLKDYEMNARYTPFKDVSIFSEEMEITVHFAADDEGYNAMIVVNDGQEITTQKKAASSAQKIERWINASVHELIA